ncbi:MAG: DUF1549 and DUF1553 domain-containing protein [Pirellulales bacterium]|nr:DUF1549 and DUF1553 domain-containing protein [Pirellulales bacterium]
MIVFALVVRSACQAADGPLTPNPSPAEGRGEPVATVGSATNIVSPPEREITSDERDHWAYRPLRIAEPPAVDDTRWGRHPIDRFIFAEWQVKRLAPLPRAGRATLIRRLTFDLTGLPPTPAEVEAFVEDASPDAYERLVDRLLASTAYGERYAQHWLDLARFAESDGFEHDLVRPNAWRYRDWVIDALNRDVPYDEFVRLQIAGDELYPGDPAAAVATGFLLCGPDMPDINLQDERRHLLLSEMTSTVGAVLLGLQVGCAQCHDHKYDAITQYDFYRLRAYFEPADVFGEHPTPTDAEIAARRAAEAAWSKDDHQRAKRRRELEQLARKRFRAKNPDEQPPLEVMLTELGEKDRGEHAELVAALANLPPLPELALGRVMRARSPSDGDRGTSVSHLYLRGDFRQPGPEVACGIPRVLESELDVTASSALLDKPAVAPSEQSSTSASSRTALAAWLTGNEQPLAARVIANRLWQWHFGTGIVGSPSDFGVMGENPTHAALLDWMAVRLAADGWSLKKMHRLIVTSETYRSASAPHDAEWSTDTTAQARAAFEQSSDADPQNRLWWRRNRVRQGGESIRDAMLATSDRLSARRGGPGVRPPLPPEITVTLLKDQWNTSGDAEDHRRRSIYLFVRRNLRYPLFDVFDRPDTNATCPMRHESTTATQSLVLLNSAQSLDGARHLAGVVMSAAPHDVDQQIAGAYRRVFARAPDDTELQAALEFLQRQAAELKAAGREPTSLALPDPLSATSDPHAAAALVDFCLALFNSSEAVYVD